MASITNRLPDDPDVQIPAAVKAAGAAADELHRQFYAEAPVEEQTEAETQNEISPEPQEEKPTDPPLTPEPPAEEPKQLELPLEKTVSEEDWQHRYKAMKGRFDRSQQQIQAMADQISSLEKLIATMQMQAPPAASSEMTFERLITPEEEQDYGQEFLNVVSKKAKETLTPEVAKLQREIESLKQQLGGVNQYVEVDAVTRLEQALDREVSNWRDLNTNPDFLEWLQLREPYSGDIRHKLLMAAWDRRDASRVAAFFKGFLAEEAAVAPARVAEPVSNKIPLESLAAPGRAKTAAGDVGAPAEKPTFSRAQIAAFYADTAAGRYRGREAEKDRLEKQIFEAQRDGRIRS